MSNHDKIYGRVELPRIPPVVTEATIEDVKQTSEPNLYIWGPHRSASPVVQALHASLLRTNIDNSARHSQITTGSVDVDANRLALGRRPQSALFLNESEGIKAIEVLATLSSSSDEPSNPFSTHPTERGRDLILQKDAWIPPAGGMSRTRLKLTRYYPEKKSQFVILQSKIDQQGLIDTESGGLLTIKGRRSGYLKLDGLAKDIRQEIDVIVNTPDYEPDSPTLALARFSVIDYLSSGEAPYQAVVDRVYVTKADQSQEEANV